MFLLYILYIGSKAESPNKSPGRIQLQVHVPNVTKSPKNSWLHESNTKYKSWVPIVWVQFQVTKTVQAESLLPESQVIKSLKCLQCCKVADSKEVTSNKEGTCRSFLHGVRCVSHRYPWSQFAWELMLQGESESKSSHQCTSPLKYISRTLTYTTEALVIKHFEKLIRSIW